MLSARLEDAIESLEMRLKTAKKLQEEIAKKMKHVVSCEYDESYIEGSVVEMEHAIKLLKRLLDD